MSEVDRSSSAEVPGPPSEGKKKRRLLLRHPGMIALVLMAAVFATIAVYATVNAAIKSADGIHGPFGAFPSPVATAPPVGPARLLATLEGEVKVTGGLALQDNDDSRLRAINLRTGKVYWEDRRHNDAIVDWKPDGSGSVFIAWSSGRVERVEIRSGKRLWHQRFTGSLSLDISGNGPVNVSTTMWRHYDHEGALIFLDRGTGRERWRIRTFSKGACSIGIQSTVQWVLHIADTLVAREDCRSEKDPGRLTAFDATGHRRWQLDLKTLMPSTDGHPDRIDATRVSDRLLALTRYGRGYTLVDVVAGRMIKKVPSLESIPDDEREERSDSISVNSCAAPHVRSEDATGPYLCAKSSKTDKPLWTVHLPEGFRGSNNRFAVSGGRFYTVLTHTDAADKIDIRDEQQVGVFELRTGRLLGRMPLPSRRAAYLPQEIAYEVSDVTDGVVSVDYRTRERSYTKLLAA
ncbi:PQQ-binding-like beta-propeller repeat protein [Spirillospora sp. NPDC052269]